MWYGVTNANPLTRPPMHVIAVLYYGETAGMEEKNNMPESINIVCGECGEALQQSIYNVDKWKIGCPKCNVWCISWEREIAIRRFRELWGAKDQGSVKE